MEKAQAPCVQHLPGTVAGRVPVHLIAKDRVPDRVEMHPDLVCSTSVNLAQNQSPLACLSDHVKSGVSRPATVDDRHFLPMHRMPADRLDNIVSSFCEASGAQRQVEFLNLSAGELVAQPQ